MKSILLILTFVLFAGLGSPAYAQPAQNQQQIAIVANKSVKVSDLEKQELVDIFSLEEGNWKDGARIVPIELKGESAIKSMFYNFLGRPANEIKRERLRLILAGDSDPPLTVASVEETLEAITSTPGSIGYMPLNMATGDVVILQVIDY